MARVTGDRARDVSDRTRAEVERKLTAMAAHPEWIRVVHELVPVAEAERAAWFGESLPVGLRLVDAPATG
jgi:LmbE family N-acetylglucosaminyl deacetylase